jgi:hypothetical protein
MSPAHSFFSRSATLPLLLRIVGKVISGCPVNRELSGVTKSVTSTICRYVKVHFDSAVGPDAEIVFSNARCTPRAHSLGISVWD